MTTALRTDAPHRPSAEEVPPAVCTVRRLHVRAEIRPVLDGVAWVRVVLWGSRVRSRKAAPFWEEVVSVYRELLGVARHVLPPPPPGVVVDVFPAEPALFERTAGHDEVRVRVRAIAKRPSDLDAWAHALWTNLRRAEAKVEPSSWSRSRSVFRREE